MFLILSGSTASSADDNLHGYVETKTEAETLVEQLNARGHRYANRVFEYVELERITSIDDETFKSVLSA